MPAAARVRGRELPRFSLPLGLRLRNSQDSVQRQIGQRWTFEAAYVARFGRRLLQQRDLAAATDLVDPKSGMDYYAAARLMSQFALAHGEDPSATISPIPYFEDLFPWYGAMFFSLTVQG